MSNRLNDLQRQRALAQEQVAWFDREIARERGEKILPAIPTPATFASATPAITEKSVALRAAEADMHAAEIIERFKQTEPPVRDDVRRGCFLYFFGAFVLLVLAVFAFYMLHRHQD